MNWHRLTKEHLHLARAIFLYAKVDLLLLEGDQVDKQLPTRPGIFV